MKSPTFDKELSLWNMNYSYVAGIDEVGRGCLAGPVMAGCVIFQKFSIFNFPLSIEGNTQKSQITMTNDQSGKVKNGEKVEKVALRDRIIINDSKKMTRLQREKAAIWIMEHALAWGIGEASVEIINELGIVGATREAYKRAIENANNGLRTKNLEQREMINDKCPMINGGGGKVEQVGDASICMDSRLRGNDREDIDFLLIDAFYIPDVPNLNYERQRAIVKGDSVSISIAAASIIAKVHRDAMMHELGQRKEYAHYDWCNNKGYGTLKHREAIQTHGICKYHRKLFTQSYVK